MPQILYLRLAQTPQQRRRVGARGGKATARNRRAHLSAVVPSPPEGAAPATSQAETTAAAIAALDAHFPWLRGVEKGAPTTARPQGGHLRRPACDRARQRIVLRIQRSDPVTNK